MSVLLEVHHLTKRFKDLTAVNSLSFTVNQGDVYGFLGQNGAGKSTSIRMILTLIKPDEGDIFFLGKNIKTHRNDILKQTGAVIERPDLYKYLSAYDNVAIFAKMSGVKVTRKLVMDQLALVGLAERSSSKVNTFSQGMKQRLGIAVALVHDPKLVILDEPTNGLDPQGIADMRQLILMMQKDLGKTIIVSSHLLNEIEQIANRMIIINKGKKIAEGVVAEMLDPAKSIVLLDTTDNTSALDWLQQSAWSANLQRVDHLIRLQMSKADIPSMVSALSLAGIHIQSLQPRHSLEDYFLNITNAENHVESFTN